MPIGGTLTASSLMFAVRALCTRRTDRSNVPSRSCRRCAERGLMRFVGIVGLVLVSAAVVVTGAAAFGFTDDSLTLSSETVGSPYSAQLHARNGCPPYSFHVSGASLLPPGLSLQRTG